MPKVLVVDDDYKMRSLVAITMTNDAHYQVLTASDGVEGILVARREKPDLVTLDARMPGMDGFEVCRAIKSDPTTAHASVVMPTALTEEYDKARGVEAGADTYITKPFSPAALLTMVQEVLHLN